MSIEKELRQNWDSVVYPEPDVVQEAMPPGYQEGDVLLAQARHPRTGRPMTGPTMSDVTEPAMGLLNMGASTLKGVTQGFLGLPGDLEALVYGAKELLTRRADESAFDAFINGLKKETILPTTEEVKKWLDTNVGEVPGVKTFETLGETIAPGGQYKAVKAGAKALKNMPVGMSTEAVGGMQKVLTPPNATAPTSDIGFFSAVEQAALNIKRNSGTGQAMLNDITKGENVKADEIKWIGLDEFLAGKKNVTKQEVQDFIASNKVDVQEVQLGGDVPAEYRKQYYQITDLRDRGGQISNDEWRRRITRLNNEYGFEPDAGPSDALRPNFSAYTLPGGQNYREILLTMPFKEPAMPKGYEVTSVQYDDGTYRYFANTPTTRSAAYKTEADAMAELQSMASRLKGFRENQEAFKSSHWNQNNVLAHIRVNDRVDADGKKMLLVEEVQSDWHQAGRDKGYATADISTRLKESEKELEQIGLQIRGLNNRMSRLSDDDLDEFNKLADERQKLYDRQGVLIDEGNALIDRRNAGVPDAPMKDTWYQLALKRVLKYATDNGYERVGLTTGSRQAERYDLSAQVDEIKVPMVADDGSRSVAIKPVDGGTIKLMVDSDGTVTGYGPSARQFTGKKIDEVIGKELADKVMKAEEDTSLTGLDLKVGGQGMKKYYDEVYPQFLAKYGKKWGAKVGETQIKVGSDKVEPGISAPGIDMEFPAKTIPAPMEPVRYIDITPQMKESVGKGQPLFSATGIATGAGAGTMATSQQEPK